MSQSDLSQELRNAPVEPLLPIEKKLIGWSLGTGVVLLIIAAIRFVRLPGHGFWFRAHAILLAIGGIAFGVFVWQYDLLGMSQSF